MNFQHMEWSMCVYCLVHVTFIMKILIGKEVEEKDVACFKCCKFYSVYFKTFNVLLIGIVNSLFLAALISYSFIFLLPFGRSQLKIAVVEMSLCCPCCLSHVFQDVKKASFINNCCIAQDCLDFIFCCFEATNDLASIFPLVICINNL